MGKHKRELKKQEKQWKVVEWILIIVVGLVIGYFVADWINTQPFAQPRHAKPGELSFQLPMLIAYLGGLVLMVISGFLYARRIDKIRIGK